MSKGWIGVDLDGTLAHYEGWKGIDHIGEPIPAMVDRVQEWLTEKKDVRIFTARVSGLYIFTANSPQFKEAERALYHVREWCKKHIGVPLPVTAVKDQQMIMLWDDRCTKVETNTGAVVATTPNHVRVRHKKRGTEYVLIGYGKMQADEWVIPHYSTDVIEISSTTTVDMREVAIYRSVDDGALWVRPREEFEDGRFEVLSPAAREPVAVKVLDRNQLGRVVREAWVHWATQQPEPKQSWLVPYDDLSEADKEADRQIGEAVASWTLSRREEIRNEALEEAAQVVENSLSTLAMQSAIRALKSSKGE